MITQSAIGPVDPSQIRSFGLTLTGKEKLVSRIKQLLKSEKGASMVEYGLLVILIAIVAIVAVTLIGEQTSTMYSEIGSGFDY
jgi:pilus assembly protein Flp/PilA